ncbi:MAG: YbhB/YbcL family Raf kinase inhibitor-like protein [Chloroflexota bacterium]
MQSNTSSQPNTTNSIIGAGCVLLAVLACVCAVPSLLMGTYIIFGVDFSPISTPVVGQVPTPPNVLGEPIVIESSGGGQPSESNSPIAPPDTSTSVSPIPAPTSLTLELTSPAFPAEGPIPFTYTCDDADVSPPLQWGNPPAGTNSFALIMDDPDAPGNPWVHWVIYNIPAGARSLPEAMPWDADLPDGSRNGLNSWQELGYGGPCPIDGPHRYLFTLYALSSPLELPSGATKEQLVEAIQPLIVSQGQLAGTYASE